MSLEFPLDYLVGPDELVGTEDVLEADSEVLQLGEVAKVLQPLALINRFLLELTVFLRLLFVVLSEVVAHHYHH